MLWTTRFVRHPLWFTSDWPSLWRERSIWPRVRSRLEQCGVLAGWLAITAASWAWRSGRRELGSRRVKLSEFYTEPCFPIGLSLIVGAYAWPCKLGAWAEKPIVLAAAALGLNVLVTMLLARKWRRAELTYLAVFHFVTATYLVLFSVGKNDPKMAYVLGLAAVIEAIVLWGIGIVCQRVRDAWTNESRPAALSLGGSVDRRRGSAQRSFLGRARTGGRLVPLTVKSLPRADWLYGTVAAVLARVTSDGSTNCRASN